MTSPASLGTSAITLTNTGTGVTLDLRANTTQSFGNNVTLTTLGTINVNNNTGAALPGEQRPLDRHADLHRRHRRLNVTGGNGYWLNTGAVTLATASQGIDVAPGVTRPTRRRHRGGRVRHQQDQRRHADPGRDEPAYRLDHLDVRAPCAALAAGSFGGAPAAGASPSRRARWSYSTTPPRRSRPRARRSITNATITADIFNGMTGVPGLRIGLFQSAADRHPDDHAYAPGTGDAQRRHAGGELRQLRRRRRDAGRRRPTNATTRPHHVGQSGRAIHAVDARRPDSRARRAF